jgi:hypothetical protein
VRPGASFALGFDLQSVAGLQQAQLIASGALLETKSFDGAPRAARVDFALTTERNTWYSMIVEDVQGHKAYTDPIWIDAVDAPLINAPNGRSRAAIASRLDPTGQEPNERRGAHR